MDTESAKSRILGIRCSFGYLHRLLFSLSTILVLADLSSSASIVGSNSPALPLTVERINKLPYRQRAPWEQYLQRSDQQLQADQAFFRTEMRENGINEPTTPPAGRSVRSVPLGRSSDWYGDTEAKRIADIILSFQTPAGGWSKNLDMSQHRRGPGERFAVENSSLHPSDADFDTPHDILWNYIGTFDNDATVTQLRFLSKVIAALDAERGVAYRAAFLHGIDYILAAQYPNGGWPQVWPLQGGYHDTITFNDDAMTNILELLRDVSQGTNEFAFVPRSTREQAAASIENGIKCILATQIRVGWTRTVWCQQHDPLTLQPASARNYEMPCQSAGESARIMLLLMQQTRPNLPIVDAVHAAAAWFEKTKLKDVAFRRTEDGGRSLVPSPGSPPLWARYYEIGTDRPIFGDRDKTIHDRVEDISLERRRGYAWYVSTPAEALEKYAEWSKVHPPRSNSPLYTPKKSPYFKPTVKTSQMPPA